MSIYVVVVIDDNPVIVQEVSLETLNEEIRPILESEAGW
jgi:hypothetical protein